MVEHAKERGLRRADVFEHGRAVVHLKNVEQKAKGRLAVAPFPDRAHQQSGKGQVEIERKRSEETLQGVKEDYAAAS